MRRLTPFFVVLALLPAACGEDPPEDITPLGPQKPLKVQHAMDEETRVPYRAERPVTLDPPALETALALGVKPVGSATPDGKFPSYLGSRTRGIENVGPGRRPDLDAVAKLDPDVIIGNALLDKRPFKRFDVSEETDPEARDKGIPTVMSGIPIKEWKSDVRFYGDALGRSDQSEDLLKDYDARVARTRRALEGTRKTPAQLLRALSPALRRELSPSFLADVFRDAGLRPPASTGQGRAGGLIAARLVLDDLRAGAR